MMRQYFAQRFCAGSLKRIGTILVGTIVYIQDGRRPLSGFRDSPVCRNPWIVESWHPGIHCGKAMAGGHLAAVRSLRDGRRQQVADWILLACMDAGLEKL
jgi:hypothetical protein